jgi:arginase
MIHIIGAPFDLCGLWHGSRLGPAAVRLENLEDELRKLDHDVIDLGDVPGRVQAIHEPGMKHFRPLIEVLADVRQTVLASLRQDALPLVLGGEHTLAIGSVSAAIEYFGEEVALLWIDAHADVNTPGTSSTGNIHGMPIAALAGMDSGVSDERDLQWRELLSLIGPRHLQLDHVAWFGLRDVDPAERTQMEGLAVTMHHIDRFGIESTMNQIDQWLRKIGAKHLWVSFDVDALDPILAPGTGTAVRGGLTYREAHLFAELLWEAMGAESCPYGLVGIDIVETNPLRDTNNATARMAVEWVASLLGKSILGKAPGQRG